MPTFGLPTLRLTALFLAALFLAATTSQAQSLRATVDRKEVTTVDQIVLRVTLEGADRVQPRLPDLSDFQVHSAGQSTQVSFVNGRASSNITFSYILVPRGPGTFPIGPVEAEVGGKTLRSQPFEVRVLEASAEPRPDDDLFLRARISTSTPYAGQQVIYTWQFYRRLDRQVGNAQLRPIDFQGFLVEDLGEVSQQRVTYQGQEFVVSTLRKALFPQEVGTFTLPATRLDCQVAVNSPRRRRGSLFDEFFGNARVENRTLRTGPTEITVRPLPAPPSGFSGLVGDFQVRTSLSKAEIQVGESTTVKVTVSGRGNIQMAGEPELAEMAGVKVYDDKPSTSKKPTAAGLSGTKTYTKALVPQAAGELTLPGVELVYFDPQAGTFRTATAAPLSLLVTPGDGREELRLTEALAPAAGKVAVRILADDILPIHKDLGAVRGPGVWSRPGPVFFGALATPMALFLATALVRRRRASYGADGHRRRRKLALSKARRRLAEARRAEQQGDPLEASAEASRALKGLIGDKLNLEGTALTPTEAAALLQDHGAEADTVRRIRESLERLEAAQYAGNGASRAATQELEPLLDEIAKALERGKGRRPGRAALLGLALPLALVLAGPAWGQDFDPSRTFVEAAEAYEAGEYGEAVDLYRHLVEAGYSSGEMHYNLGNALLRHGELGRAIAAYRRAQLERPRDQDLDANLAFARKSTKDALQPPRPSALIRTLFFWHFTFSPRELQAALLLANALFWSLLALSLLYRRSELLRWSAGLVLILTLAVFGSLGLRWIAPAQVAVMVPAEVEVRSGTSFDDTVLFKLHAGTEVRLVDRRPGWLRIALPSQGQGGWIEESVAEVVEI